MSVNLETKTKIQKINIRVDPYAHNIRVNISDKNEDEEKKSIF